MFNNGEIHYIIKAYLYTIDTANLLCGTFVRRREHLRVPHLNRFSYWVIIIVAIAHWAYYKDILYCIENVVTKY